MTELDPAVFAIHRAEMRGMELAYLRRERAHVLNQALTYFCLDLLEGSRPR